MAQRGSDGNGPAAVRRRVRVCRAERRQRCGWRRNGAGPGLGQRHRQSNEPERHHQLADLQHRLGRDDQNLDAELEFDPTRSRDRRPRPLANPRHAVVKRQGVPGQSGRHPVRDGRAHQCRQPVGDHQRHRQQATSWPGTTISLFRAIRTPRSSIWGGSRRRPAVSPRWWRPACAIPARSPRSSAPSRSLPATCSRSTCTATI